MKTDLNLLRVLHVILEERNLSKAAKRLHLTQPALSRSLVRLRDEFNDPLFVRTSSGMLPTPFAQALEPELRSTLEKLDSLYQRPEAFRPEAATGVVRIATTDYFEQVVWTELIGKLSAAAPNLTFVTQLVGGELPYEAMRSGSINLAIAGYFTDVPAAMKMQKLFEDTFTVVARHQHPLVKKRLTLEQYLECGHVLISPRGDLSGAVDRALQKQRKHRHIAASVAGFLSSGSVVANSDLLLTAPSLLAAQFARSLPVQAFAPPLDLPIIKVVQVWHERFHQDPLLTWVRQMIADHCGRIGRNK